MITNQQRADFLNALKLEVDKPNGLLLTEWEAEFLASFGKAYRWWNWFTDARQAATDKMWMRYGGELGLPFGDDLIREPSKIADGDPDGCQFLISDENRRQSRCNEPAVLQEPGRLRYCQSHADEVVKQMKWAKQTIRLVAFFNPDVAAAEAEQQLRPTIGGAE